MHGPGSMILVVTEILPEAPAYPDERVTSRDIPLSALPALRASGGLTMEHTRCRFLGSAAAIAAALGIDGFDSSLTAAPPKDLPSGP